MRQQSSRLSAPLALVWSSAIAAVVVAAVAACATPGGMGGMPRASSAVYHALRSGYEAAPTARSAVRQPLADLRDEVI